jgi:hypothetical protein
VADPGQRPLSALPSPLARALGFAAIVLGGLAGGVIGWAFVAIQSDTAVWQALGAAIGAIAAAAGTAVIAVLVLRAMGEWRAGEVSASELMRDKRAHG